MSGYTNVERAFSTLDNAEYLNQAGLYLIGLSEELSSYPIIESVARWAGSHLISMANRGFNNARLVGSMPCTKTSLSSMTMGILLDDIESHLRNSQKAGEI